MTYVTPRQRYVSIHAHHLQTIVEHKHRGQYDFPTGMTLHRATTGNINGRMILEIFAFAWHGQSGSLIVNYYLVPEHLEQTAKRRVSNPTEYYEPIEDLVCTPPTWTEVRVITD